MATALLAAAVHPILENLQRGSSGLSRISLVAARGNDSVVSEKSGISAFKGLQTCMILCRILQKLHWGKVSFQAD